LAAEHAPSATIQPLRAQLGAQVGREVAKKIPRVARQRRLGHAADLHAARAAGHLAADAAELPDRRLRAGR
jgi:hypothetical protein